MKSASMGMVAALASLVLALGCSHKIPDPASPNIIENRIPPTPFDLSASVGDRFARLSWSMVQDTTVYSFRVYIAPYDSSGAVFSLLGESDMTSFDADGLADGRLYYFKVSAVDEGGFEGYKSDSIAVVPNLFGLSINDGQDYTNSRDVQISLLAPEGTRLMELSEDSSFAGSQWEDFSASRSFRLSAGDGSKTVFGRFRDARDGISAGPVSGTIVLDTHAVIDSVQFTPSGAPFSPGDNVHFSIYTGETDGEAEIALGQNITTIELNDDGFGGDGAAGDGIYEADYSININLDFETQNVYGNFTDRAGNAAPQAVAGQTMSVRRPPDPVSIYSISLPDGYFDRVELAWSTSTASDFAQYKIYRGMTPGVDSTNFLVRTLSSRNASTVTDTGLTEDTQYYYRVYVIDNTGLWTGSGEANIVTGQDLPPAPVVLYPPSAVPGTHDRLELDWSASGENDFLRYELYRSNDSAVDSLDTIVFSSGSQTSFTDTGLVPDSLYYYAVLTLDTGGNSSWSNAAGGRTNPDDPPSPVTLFPIVVQPDFYQSVNVEWSQSSEEDFESYRLYRWQEDVGRADSSLVALFTDPAVTSFEDSPPFDVSADTVNFWYIIHLYDDGGNVSPSDSVRAHLVDNDPGTVTGSVEPSDNSLYISWISSDIPDFAAYHLLRDVDSDPAGAVTVYVSSDQETGSFDDTSAVQGQTYFYWLDIFDRRSNSSRSPLGSGSW